MMYKRRVCFTLKTKFSVPLSTLIKETSLETIYMPSSAEDTVISSTDVNRPGLELTGFLDYFDSNRVMIMGSAEMSFLSRLSPDERFNVINRIFEKTPPCVIITRDIQPYNEIMESAKINGIPLLKSKDETSEVMGEILYYLSQELAPRVRRHGVLVEVYGEGVLLVGDSGVGKSETAIELIKRGHRLIADDAVDIKKVSKKGLVGSAPENIRHFIELRGIGIINARRIFGMSAVKVTENIDLVVSLETWDTSKVYDRMGVETSYTEILGIEVPIVTIPIKPGRNLAVIIEIAAMDSRQKKLGYNAAKELMSNLGVDY